RSGIKQPYVQRVRSVSAVIVVPDIDLRGAARHLKGDVIVAGFAHFWWREMERFHHRLHPGSFGPGFRVKRAARKQRQDAGNGRTKWIDSDRLTRTKPVFPDAGHQKLRRSANCITRGSPASVVIVPTFVALMVRFGNPKLARFKALKTSQRKSR